jgi:Fe-S-cluster containining protein
MTEWTCRQCGRCCMTLFIALRNVPADGDEQELARWMALHHCEPMRYADGSLAVQVPLVCQWLEHDGERYRCRDYEHRPRVCREYQCHR